MTYANETFFNDPSAMGRALVGITSPQRRVIDPGTLLFRYGNDPDNARRGSWWLNLEQRTRLVNWAILHEIAVPHAVRIMFAIMHEWEPAKPGDPPVRSTMNYAVRAATEKPLLAYEGESRPQVKRAGKDVEAMIGPGTLTPPMTQLFIPGLHDNLVCREALSYESIVSVEPGASAIFGMDQVVPTMH